MALARVIDDSSQSPFRVKLREVLFPYTIPGSKRTLSTMGKYETTMIFLYLVNMIVLALPNGYDGADSDKTRTLKGFELFFTCVYMLEIALSGAAFGFLDLLHPVRLMDSVMVMANLAILIGFYNGNDSWRFSLLPARCSLRILRPFFVTTEFPNMRLFVVSVARSILQLTDVTLLFIFFLLWFGVAGVFQFGGTLQTRCVSDFYTFGSLDEAQAVNFFGAPSTISWAVSKQNSTLNTIKLDTTFSSFIPFNSVFGPIINNTNVSEKMLVQAMHSFASSYITFYQLRLGDFVCGADYMASGDFTTGLAAALSADEHTPPQRKHYVRRLLRPPPRYPSNSSRSVSSTIYTSTVTRSYSLSPTLEYGNVWYSHRDVITPPELLASLRQCFQLDPVFSCSIAQTCGKEPAKTLTGFICPYSYTCLPNVFNPYNNSVSFDNIGMSMLALFVSNTFELWYEVMWWQRDASDELALPFMLLEVVIGSFMIIGLMVVVLTVEYDKAKAQERDRIAAELEQRKAFRKRKEAAKDKDGENDEGDEEPIMPQAEQEDPFAIFSMPKRSKKDSSDKAQEDEDNDDRERNRGSVFASIVQRAKMQKAKEEQEEQEMEEKPSVAVEQRSEAQNGGAQDGNGDAAPEEPGSQPTTKSMFTLSMVAMFRRKIRSKIQQKRIERGEADPEEEAQKKDGGNDSEDSEEELRIEAKKQQELREAELQQKKLDGHEDDSDSDEEDEQKLRRRAARAILRRKLEKESNPWKFKFRKARFYAKWYIVQSRWFNIFVTVAVLCSTATTCVEHYGMSQETRNTIDTLNIFWTLLFVVELSTRMLADTAARFLRHFFNIFDACNVTIGLLDLVIGNSLPFLRALRVFRVYKLIDMSAELKKWIFLIADACTASPMLIFILLLVMFIFSTFGMQLFGGAFCGMDIAGASNPGPTIYHNTSVVPINFTSVNGTLVPTAWENVTELVYIPSHFTTDCENLPRANFDSFGAAMLTSFIIATGDNWNYVMYNGMNAVNVAVAVPFVVYFYVAVYILMNLLVSILLSAADREHSATEEELLEQQRQHNEAEKKALLQKAAASGGEEDPFAVKEYTEEDVERMLQNNSDEEDKQQKSDEEEEEDDDDEDADVIVSRSGKVKEKSRSGKVVEELSRMWDRSRRSLRALVEHQVWQTLMVLNILVGTFAMGFENPIAAPDSQSVQTTRDFDLAVNVIFVVELALYIHVYGLVRKPSAYLRRDGWNIVDFILIILSFCTMIVLRAGSLDSTSRTMFVVFFLRALRPMRVIRRARGMRKVMSSILGSLPEMKNVFIVTLGIFATWGVFGVFFFAGQLRSCYFDGSELPELDEATCLQVGGEYINSDMNFDNIFFAVLTIFVCATLENWAIVMFKTMDIVADGQPFRKNANAWASLYFVVAAAFGGLLVMNLFVSVLISSYNERKRKAAFQRSILLTKEQEAWITTNKRLARLLPIRNQKAMAREHQVVVTKEGLIVYHSQVATLTPQSVVEKQEGEQIAAKVVHHVGRFRVKLREITRSSTFLNLFLAIVLANFIITAVVHYPQSASLSSTIETIQQAFTICFVVEAALKIGGETFAVYISSTWNRLDFLVATVSLLSMILSSFYNAKPFSLIQTLRITRLARLTKEYFSLDRMISKFGAAILSLGHVMSLIVMVYFIYAVLGMRMFGRLVQEPFGGSGNGGASDGIDTNQNFGSLGHAMLLLMRLTTAGDWPVVLVSCSQAFSPAPHFCDPNIGSCGLAVPAAEIYFVTFIFIATVVLTNLFTAVLLDAFGSSGMTRALRKKEAELFFHHWKQYDPDDTMTINPYDVLPLIRALPKECVLGFNSRPKRKRIGLEVNLLTSLQMVDLSHRVTWVALVDALCRAAYPIPFKARSSIAYLVYTDLLHLPMQQFAQIGRNMLEITGAAQNFGKTAFMNVQRISRLVSGKKVKRRNRSRRSRSQSSKKKRSGNREEVDVNSIHQDVMMFLSTMPPDCTFNPFLLPPVFLSALKTIAIHSRDEMMKHFLHLNKNIAEEVDDNGEPLAQDATAKSAQLPSLSESALASPIGGATDSNAFSPRESGGDTNSEVNGLGNTSMVEGSSIANEDIEDEPVLHLADLFPATHPVMVMLQPTDLRDLFSKCAALIMINAVIKKRRTKLAKRVLESKIEREILSKLQRELGIVVPESVLRRSSNYHGQDNRGNGNGLGDQESVSTESPLSKRSRSFIQVQSGGHMSSGTGGAGSGAVSEIALDSRFSVHAKPEEARERRSTVVIKEADPNIVHTDPLSPAALTTESGEAVAVSATSEAKKVSAKPPALPQDEFEISYKPSTVRIPPRATELVPDHTALEPLKWPLSDDAHHHHNLLSRGGGANPQADDGAGLSSLLTPYGQYGDFAQVVVADPILSANLFEEVQLTRSTMHSCLLSLTEWRDVSEKLHSILRPLLQQGLQPLVFSEDLSDTIELLTFRALGAATTSTHAIKKASGTKASSTAHLAVSLKTLIDESTIPSLGRPPQLLQDALARQVQAGKERQNDHVTQLMTSYKKLAAMAEKLEKNVVDVWPNEARKTLEADAIALASECAQEFKRIEIDGVMSVFAGGKLPKTMYQTQGAVTTQITTAPVNPEGLAYRWASLYRTLETVEYVSSQWDNIRAVRMVANPRATLTAASLKAVQYYYSVTDLSELSARNFSNSAKAQARSMSFPQAVDKLVVNSLFRSPSPSNLDSLTAVLQDVLVQEVRRIIDGTGAIATKKSITAKEDEKRRRSSTMKGSTANASVAKTMVSLAANAKTEEVVEDPLANESDEKRCLRLLRTELSTRIAYKPQEREDPYLTSLINFCSTLSKSEKMKAESKISQHTRTNSVFATADAKSSGELIQRIPELLTLDEFEQQIAQDLEALTLDIIRHIKFLISTPRKFVAAGAGCMKSVTKWKSGEISDFCSICVRELIVSSERDNLNVSVDNIQKQRKLLAIAETEVDVLSHIASSHRSALSSITAYTLAVGVSTDILQKLEIQMQECPDEVLLLRNESGVTVHALTRAVVCPFATQPDARAAQHMFDAILALHAWSNALGADNPLHVDSAQDTFCSLGKVTNVISNVAKEALRALALHGHSHASAVTSAVQRLYRNQPGLDAALEGYARASSKAAVALNDLQRAFVRLLGSATELIASYEAEKQKQLLKPQRRAAARHEPPPTMIQDSTGDEAFDGLNRGSSTQSSMDDPLDLKPSSHADGQRSVKQSPSALRRGPGRTHEQLIADAKARMEARKLGRLVPEFRDVSASPDGRELTTKLSTPMASAAARARPHKHVPVGPLLLGDNDEEDGRAANGVAPTAHRAGLQSIAGQISCLCRPPKPSPPQVLDVLIAMLDHKMTIRYFQLQPHHSSSTATSPEKKYERLPRNEILYLPALLKLSLPFALDGEGTIPRNVGECFAHASLSVTKKAKREDTRATVAVSNITQIRYPLSLSRDKDCGFDAASPVQKEWVTVLPRVVAVNDEHRAIHFFLFSQEALALQFFQVLDAVRDSATL